MSDLYSPTRRELLRNAGRGVAILMVSGIAVATAATPAEADIAGWRWCRRCQGMWFNGSTNRHCPVFDLFEHFHYDSGSAQYTVRRGNEEGNGQTGWHWCNYCAIMWFWGSGERGYGICPSNPSGLPGHNFGDVLGSDVLRDSYRLETTFSNNGPGGQSNWRWCQKCSGLFFAGNGVAATHCPAGGNHDGSQSWNYVLRG